MMRAIGALFGMALALAASGPGRAQTLDPRAALFAAPFARQVLTPDSSATQLIPFGPSGGYQLAGGPSPYATGAAILQPSYLSAADEGAFSLGGRPALSVSGAGYDVTFTPQGAVEARNGVSSTRAGALVQVGADVQGRVMEGLNRLGLHTVSGADLENRGRVYLFAAYSGREVGFNIARGSQGGFQRLGWSAEGASTLVSDAQAGFGWRKGAMQASLGYVHRDVNSNDAGFGAVGMQKLSDNMVAFSFSLHGR